MPDRLTGVLLCGGQSRRMGRDKGGLTLDGKTFLELQAEKLRAAGAEEVLLSGGSTDLPGARRVPDLYPDRGPLGGLHACLREAGRENCLVLCVDVPRVPVEALRGLAAAHETGGGAVTVLRGPEGREPLIAVYRRELWHEMEELIREGSAPVRALLDRVRTAEFPYNGPPELLRNCNTPEDYQAVQEQG